MDRFYRRDAGYAEITERLSASLRLDPAFRLSHLGHGFSSVGSAYASVFCLLLNPNTPAPK